MNPVDSGGPGIVRFRPAFGTGCPPPGTGPGAAQPRFPARACGHRRSGARQKPNPTERLANVRWYSELAPSSRPKPGTATRLRKKYVPIPAAA